MNIKYNGSFDERGCRLNLTFCYQFRRNGRGRYIFLMCPIKIKIAYGVIGVTRGGCEISTTIVIHHLHSQKCSNGTKNPKWD